MSVTPESAHDYFLREGHYGLTPDVHSLAKTATLTSMPVSTDIDYRDLPKSAGVRKWMQVENQGQEGSCAGHARTSCGELSYYRASRGKIIQLCRQYAYVQAQERDGLAGRDSGSSVESHAYCSQHVGTCEESLWPYTGHYQLIPRDRRQELDANANKYKIGSSKVMENYDEVLAWLVHGLGGCQTGIAMSLNPGSDGIVNSYRQYGGGHSMSLLDWNMDIVDSKGRPFIGNWNSWGSNWGDQGIAWIHPDVVTQWCQRQTVIAFSLMTDIVPLSYEWLKHEPWLV